MRKTLKMASEPERLLTPDDLARLLGTSRTLVIRQSREGKIPAIKIGKAWRFRRSTIDRWLAEQERADQIKDCVKKHEKRDTYQTVLEVSRV
jgi:excisionase family DNA binding protein